MELRRLGRTGLQVSVLGFGAAEIGLENVALADASRLLNGALDAGVNVIDTAECYNGSEELIGKAISHRRDSFHLFTKCGHAHGLVGENWDPKTIVAGIDRSLQRLNVDHVDLIQLHSCPLDLLKQGHVIEVLEKARDAGKTRFIGLSADGNAAAYGIGTGRFDVLQTSFSIADQEFLKTNAALAAQNDMGVIAKRPLANSAWRHAERPADPWLHAYWDRIHELAYPFLAEGGEQAFATALRFTLHPTEISTAIVGTTKLDHLARNVRAIGEGPLAGEEFNAIRQRWSECGDQWPGKG